MKSVVVLALASLLAACGGGMDRAGKDQLKIDPYDCPDLSGLYAFDVPGEGGVSYRESMLEAVDIGGGRKLGTAQMRGVSIQRVAPGHFEFRFFIRDEDVMRELDGIRVVDRPRYREWYDLLRDPGRRDYIAVYGEADYARRLVELGPRSEVVQLWRAGTEVACKGGWLEIPRTYGGPIRLSRGAEGGIVGESKEYTTFDVPMPCPSSSACQDMKIPTGTYTGTLYWPPDPGQRPWRAATAAAEARYQRPIDLIEAEQAAQAAAQARFDALRYAPIEVIRGRIEALLPPDIELREVELRHSQVFVRYRTDAEEGEGLVRAVRQAGGRGPENILKRRVVGGSHDWDVEFVLTDSPLVARERRATAQTGSAPGAVDGQAEQTKREAADGQTSHANSAEARQPGSAGPASASLPVLAERAPAQPPPGFASAVAIRRRFQPLFPAGCRLREVRYGGDGVTLSGSASERACVSNGLRAIERAQGADVGMPELIDHTIDAEGMLRFSIRVRASVLTRE